MLSFPAELRTPRLLLRPVAAEDLVALADMYRDPETMRYLGGTRTREQACAEIEEAVAGFEIHGLGMRILERLDDGRTVGRCGLEFREGEFELGYLLARSAWGRGFATEAAIAVRDAAMGAGATRMVCVVPADNLASIRVVRRLGMTEDGPAACHDQDAIRFVYDGV